MAIVFAINGSPVTVQPGWDITANANGVDVLNCEIVSKDGTRIAARNDEITVTRDGNRIFGGIIRSAPESGFGGSTASDAITTRINAEDFNVYASFRTDIYGTRPAETLKARLTWLQANYFADYGVTLDGSQADGPTVPERSYDYETGIVVLDELATLYDGAIWEIDYDKVLRVFLPTASAAPVNFVDGDGHVEGDITVDPTAQNFANYIIFRYDGSKERNDTLIATEVVDPPDEPGQTVFFLNYIHASNDGVLTIDGVPDIDMASNGWTVEQDPNSPSGWSLVTTTPQDEGTVIEFRYYSAFAGVAIAKDDTSIAAVGKRTLVKTGANVSDEAGAQALADAYLVQSLVELNQIVIVTREHGLKPGQNTTVTIARRNLNAVFTILKVNAFNDGGQRIRYTLTAIEGVVYSGVANLSAEYREWFGGQSSSSSAAVSSGSGVSTSAGKVYLLSTGVDANQANAPGDPVPAAGGGDAPGEGSIHPRIDTSARGSLAALITARLRVLDAGVSVTARLWDVTANDYCPGASTPVTSTTWQSVVFGVTLTAGAHFYELVLIPDAAAADVQGSAFLE